MTFTLFNLSFEAGGAAGTIISAIYVIRFIWDICHSKEKIFIMENIFTKDFLLKVVLIVAASVTITYFVFIKPIWDTIPKSYNLYDKASVTTLQQDAEKGDWNAQYLLGKAYYYGEGMVEKNEEKGLDLLCQVKEKESHQAKRLLYFIQAENYGVIKCQTKEEESSASSLIKK